MPITIYPPIQQTSITVGNLPVSASGNVSVDVVTLPGIDPSSPATLDNSLPVSLALDQDVPVRPTGQQPSAQSVSVVLASDQSVLPINFPATIFPPNAAQEAGGNLALLAAVDTYQVTMVELTRMVLAELRAMNVQLASLTGINVPVALDDDQLTLQ